MLIVGRLEAVQQELLLVLAQKSAPDHTAGGRRDIHRAHSTREAALRDDQPRGMVKDLPSLLVIEHDAH